MGDVSNLLSKNDSGARASDAWFHHTQLVPNVLAFAISTWDIQVYGYGTRIGIYAAIVLESISIQVK
jgi:hypothetical protein